MTRPLGAPRGGFSVESLRFPLVVIGVFGLLAGLGAWLVQGDFGLLPRILIAGGVLLLGIYVALDPEDVWEKITGRGAVYSGNTVAIALAAVVILGLLNVLGSRYQSKVDLTANQQFTLNDQSVKLVQALPQPVHVTGWLTANDSRKQDFQTLLNDYSSRSGGKITYEFNDPEAHPADAVAAGITATGTVVYQMGDKKQTSTGTTEKDVDTALVKLERPQKTIYFTTGHGERTLDGSGQTDYGTIKQNLTTDNFTVNSLNLVTQRAVPDDASAVVVAGASNPFLQEELDALKAYVDGGGKLVVLQGPTSKTDLSSILQNYQVSFSGNVVVDPAQSVPQDPRVVVVDNYTNHAITQDLRDLTFFPLTTNITYPSTSPTGMTITALAQSSQSSWGNTNQQQVQQQPSDPKGPLALAVAIDGGASTQTSLDPSATPTPTANAARIVLFGSPDLISNNSLQQVPGNATLFENSVNWVVSEDNLINIRVPDTTPRSLTVTNSQMNLIAYSSFLFLPLAVLAAGAAVWWTRR
ncbi:MAG: GldG family protein [Mycobacterium sp.]|nr:GldG family protein [Mycobacterium sp.]